MPGAHLEDHTRHLSAQLGLCSHGSALWSRQACGSGSTEILQGESPHTKPIFIVSSLVPVRMKAELANVARKEPSFSSGAERKK